VLFDEVTHVMHLVRKRSRLELSCTADDFNHAVVPVTLAIQYFARISGSNRVS
jgi:hypothetical protein